MAIGKNKFGLQALKPRKPEPIDNLGGGWNYRVIERDDLSEPFFEIREVYYTPSGEVHLYSSSSVEPHGESADELHWDLNRMLEALNRPTLKLSELPGYNVAPTEVPRAVLRELPGEGSDGEQRSREAGAASQADASATHAARMARVMYSFDERGRCRFCHASPIRSKRYDAKYCIECDVWLERQCTAEAIGRKCDFCDDRPERPSEMEKLACATSATEYVSVDG